MILSAFAMTNICHQWMLSAVVLVVTVSALDIGFLKVTFQTGLWNRNSTSPMLMTCDITHLRQCERVCAMTAVCRSFFYNPSTGVCQFHGTVFDLQREGKSQNGLQYYFRKHIYTEQQNNTNVSIFHIAPNGAQTKITIPPQETSSSDLQSGTFAQSTHIQHISLHQACYVGNLDMVRYILFKGLEDINSRDKKGWTPAMIAARYGLKSIFDFLLSRGCDLSIVNGNNNNILHVACLGGNTGIVRELLEDQKYDKDGRGQNGWTPLMFAVCYGKREAVVLLVHQGCNLTSVSDAKDNILHVACFCDQADIVKYIISLGVPSVESRGNFGRTPVFWASELGNVRIVNLLVRKGIDLNTVDDYGNNILHLACRGGHVNMVRYLVKLNMTSRTRANNNGYTPIQKAKKHGYQDIVALLKTQKQ